MAMLQFLFLIINSLFLLRGGGGKIRTPLNKILHPPEKPVGYQEASEKPEERSHPGPQLKKEMAVKPLETEGPILPNQS